MCDTSQHICGENGTQLVPVWHSSPEEWYSPAQMQYNTMYSAVTPSESGHEIPLVITRALGPASHQCPSGRRHPDHGYHR